MERGARVQYEHRLMDIFKSGSSAYFTRRGIDAMTNKYRLEPCDARICRGNIFGAESNVGTVLNTCR